MIARNLSDELAALLRREHGALADFLVALADFDEQRLWADLGYASLFDFLHRRLRLSRGAAHYRKTAAALARQYPAVLAALRDGRLCITSMIELARVITPENQHDVLPRFFHCSKREAMAIAAELHPAPALPRRDVVTIVRRVANRGAALDAAAAHAGAGEALQAGAGAGAGEAHAGAGVTLPGTSPREVPATGGAPLGRDPHQSVHPDELALTSGGAESPSVVSPSPGLRGVVTSTPGVPSVVPPSAGLPGVVTSTPADRGTGPSAQPGKTVPRDEVQALTGDLRRMHVTVSRKFVEKLEAARAALSHTLPRARTEEILEAALDLLLSAHGKRKGLVERPRARSRPAHAAHIPASVKREVWRRDEGRCQWPLEGGGVCGSTTRVEFDHVVPRAKGGPSTIENTRLLCAGHNQLAARRAFGDEWMDRFMTKRDPVVREPLAEYASDPRGSVRPHDCERHRSRAQRRSSRARRRARGLHREASGGSRYLPGRVPGMPPLGDARPPRAPSQDGFRGAVVPPATRARPRAREPAHSSPPVCRDSPLAP